MEMATKKQSGFTIIEVVLVLAIAGLIFLMVFIALPALQRSQRDTQRRDDVSRVIAQLQSYATNNRGAIPGDVQDFNNFLTTYLRADQGEFNDPQTGSRYTAVDTNPGIGQIQYAHGRQCSGENIGSSVGGRQAAVRVQLEGSGYFCQSLQ